MTDAEALRRLIVARDASEVLRGIVSDCVDGELRYRSDERSLSPSGIANEVIRRMGQLGIMAVDLP
jgi:hypothetical protein